MCSSLTRAALVTLVLMLVVGCAAPTPAPTVAPTQVAELPTQTPYPISTAYPTSTSYPTATLPPTATATPVPPTPTATATATLTPTAAATPVPVTPRPVAVQPAAPVGSAALWRTPGTYKPVAANLCATFISRYEDRDWEETFCIIQVDVTSDILRFYGQWKIKLIPGNGSFKSGIYHLSSRYFTYVVDNVGNKYVHGRLGGAADEDRLIQSPDYLMGYMDNQDPARFKHVPDSWWEFEPARPGATSFTFVNDKYGFRIGPITLSQ